MHEGATDHLGAGGQIGFDAAAIVEHFDLGLDVLTVVFETPRDGCYQTEVMAYVDQFAWQMSNVPGVLSVASVAQLAKQAYAGTNDQPYQSVGRWLLDQGAVRDASWPGIKAWLAQNPQRTQALLWSNPRVVFFREEPLTGLDAAFGPRGAQGVPLTPGRSIAVDPQSIPYGTPVWLASNGPQTSLNRLVMAQDTGSAIVGAVRADWFLSLIHI